MGQADAETCRRDRHAAGLGPTGFGVINVLNGMALTSARVLEVDKLIRAHGFVTQSGALMLSVFNRAHDANIGFSQLASVGNQADLERVRFLRVQ